MIIISTQETHDLTPDTGKLVRRMRVTWRIDDKHGPYVTYFPYDEFNGTAARLELDRLAREFRAIEA